MPTLVTKQTTIRLTEGVITLPAGLRVRPAPSFQLAPATDWFVLVDLPEDIFPPLSSRRRWAESGNLRLHRGQLATIK